MEEPYFIKCETATESSPNLNTEELLPVSVEKIKVEPDLAFTDECTEEHSLGIVKEELDIQGKFEFVTEMKPLIEETKSELPELGPTQENTFEPSADIKGEVSQEQHTTDEITPNIKQENKKDLHFHDHINKIVNNGYGYLRMAVRIFRGHVKDVKERVYESQVRPQLEYGSEDYINNRWETYPLGDCPKCSVGDLAELAVHTGEETLAGTVQSKVFLHNLKVQQENSALSGERWHHCKECNSSFIKKSNLRRHMLVHSGERAFRCKDCGSSFTQNSSLRTHMDLHSAERLYHCKECNSSFNQKSTLRTHMVVHSGERAFRCEECDSSFTKKSSLRTHMAVHSRIKAFHCKECNSSFTRKSTLLAHMVAHSGDRPFVCDICNSSFTYKVTLPKHMVVHSGEKLYHCKECNSSFTQKCNLRRHYVVHTVDPHSVVENATDPLLKKVLPETTW